MDQLRRITSDPEVTGGKPCTRGMRVTEGMIAGLIAARHTKQEILEMYPHLEADELYNIQPGALKSLKLQS